MVTAHVGSGIGVSFHLYFEATNRHSGSVKGALIINHGNSDTQMPRIYSVFTYLVVCRMKLIPLLLALCSGPGLNCCVCMVFTDLEPFSSVVDGFLYALKHPYHIVCFVILSTLRNHSSVIKTHYELKLMFSYSVL